MRRPWFRRDNCTWFVETEAGKQIRLGRDSRFDVAPRESPKEPPPDIQRHYLKVMQREEEPEDRKFSFCILEYLESLDACTETTRRRARNFFDQFLKDVGDPKVSKMRPHHCNDFVKGKGWKQNTVRAALQTINACLNHCLREGWIPVNPLRGKVKLPKTTRRELRLSTDDRQRLIDAATGPFKKFLLALGDMGARPGELYSARIENCDLEKGVLKVSNKTRNKTGVEFRPIVLTGKMIEFCRELIGGRTEGFVFLNARGTPWTKSAVRNRMIKMCAQLGIDRVPYEFRHKFASDAINIKGMNPALVALQMGHQDLKMLMQTYLHADTASIRKALEE